jgi:RNA polymerase sigma-70 factor, ECF subfamily
VTTFASTTTVDAETPLAELVLEAQTGDRAALGEIARRYHGVVYGTALRRLGHDGEAQELTQEVFVQVLRKIGQLRQPECLGGWLRSITNRLALNRLARAKAEISTENATLEAGGNGGETPLTAVLRRERQSQVRAGLDRLGDLDRETLMAFYVEGQSLVEMSTAFDSPIGTIKRRLHVARKRLALQLEEFAVA